MTTRPRQLRAFAVAVVATALAAATATPVAAIGSGDEVCVPGVGCVHPPDVSYSIQTKQLVTPVSLANASIGDPIGEVAVVLIEATGTKPAVGVAAYGVVDDPCAPYRLATTCSVWESQPVYDVDFNIFATACLWTANVTVTVNEETSWADPAAWLTQPPC